MYLFILSSLSTTWKTNTEYFGCGMFWLFHVTLILESENRMWGVSLGNLGMKMLQWITGDFMKMWAFLHWVHVLRHLSKPKQHFWLILRSVRQKVKAESGLSIAIFITAVLRYLHQTLAKKSTFSDSIKA